MKLFFSFLRILGCDLQSYKNSNVNETLMYIPSMYQVPTRERFYEKDFKSIKPRLYGFMDLKKDSYLASMISISFRFQQTL